MQNPLGQIRVQPHPLEFGHRQIAWLGPDLVGHADAADVVDVSGPAGQRDRVVVEPDRDRGIGRQLRGCARMAQGERTFQVDEVAERDQQFVQRRLVELGMPVRRVLQRHRPHVAGRRDGQQRLGVLDERVHHRGVELTASPAARHGHRTAGAVLPLVHLHHVGHLRDPHLDRDRSPAAPAGSPPPSKRSKV